MLPGHSMPSLQVCSSTPSFESHASPAEFGSGLSHCRDRDVSVPSQVEGHSTQAVHVPHPPFTKIFTKLLNNNWKKNLNFKFLLES